MDRIPLRRVMGSSSARGVVGGSVGVGDDVGGLVCGNIDGCCGLC